MKHTEFKRSDRVSHQIKEIISEIFRNKIYLEGAGLVTVTTVKTTDNLRFSRIYISFIGNEVDAKNLVELMNNNINDYRYQLGNSIQVKYVPQIKFYHDDTMDEVEKINSLINKSKNDK